MTAARRSLSQFLVPVIFLSSVLITGLYWWELTSSSERFRAQTLDQATLRARQVNSAAASEISHLFRDVDLATQELARRYDPHDLRRFDADVRELQLRLPPESIVQIGVVDADGFLAYSNLGGSRRVFLGDRDHVKAHVGAATDNLYISKPVLGRVSNQWSIQFSRPIRRNGRFAGVMVLSVSPTFLHKALVELTLGSDDAIAIFRETGEYLARNLDHEKSLGKSAAADRPFVGAQAPVSGSLRVTSNFDKRPRIYEWLRVSGYPITVVLGLSQETVLAPVEDMIAQDHRRAAIGTIVGWALVFGLFLFMRRADRQQQLVAEAEQKYRIFADFTYDWDAWLDPQGRHLLVTPSCERVTGYGPAEFLADLKLLQRIVHGDDQDRVAEHYEQAHDPSHGASRIEFRIVRKDGQVRWIEHFCDAVRGEDGRYLGRRASNRDITERKDAEEAVRRLAAELEQRVAQRTAQLQAANKDLEEFSYSISHDMRTPLRAIDGYSKILLDDHGAALNAEALRLQTEVRRNAQQMARQLDDMLEFLNLGRRRLVAVSIDMSALIREVFAETASSVPPGRQVRLEAGALPPATGDREMIRQVLRILLSNAMKFASPDRDAIITVAGNTDAGEAVYRVSDNGVGFDMRYADKLFKVFERLHPPGQYQGTAISLAAARRIVERHGGRIWADSKPGEGANFHFSLPAAENRSEPQ